MEWVALFLAIALVGLYFSVRKARKRQEQERRAAFSSMAANGERLRVVPPRTVGAVVTPASAPARAAEQSSDESSDWADDDDHAWSAQASWSSADGLRNFGYVFAPYQAIYDDRTVAQEDEKSYMLPPVDGKPPFKLRIFQGQLLLWPDGSDKPLRSNMPMLRVTNLCVAVLRGARHYERANRRANIPPLSEVLLIREPNHPHDPNAIAVWSPLPLEQLGYVPKGYAKWLAKRMDAGEWLRALVMHGTPTGVPMGVTPRLLIADAAAMEHLVSDLNAETRAYWAADTAQAASAYDAAGEEAQD